MWPAQDLLDGKGFNGKGFFAQVEDHYLHFDTSDLFASNMCLV